MGLEEGRLWVNGFSYIEINIEEETFRKGELETGMVFEEGFIDMKM